MKNYLNYVCCPICKGELELKNNLLKCLTCNKEYKGINGIYNFMQTIENDLKLSIEKWDKIYQEKIDNKSYIEDFNNYKDNYFIDTYNQLNDEKEINSNIVYLEIGCGPFFLGQLIVKKCKLIIGIDFSLNALKIAKKMFDDNGINNYILIQGDILEMPIKNNTIDLIYGGGVIEHFENTEKSIYELYRILKQNGISFNTVPYLNIGSLTYRQIRGNIPNIPFIKNLYKFIHIKLLKSKHMIFGYEMSFLGSTLINIHKKVGFKEVKINKFNCKLLFDFVPNFLRKSLIFLANNCRLFWPMIKVIGKK